MTDHVSAVRLRPSVRRSYFAAAAVLATLLLQRQSFRSEWTFEVVREAGLADLSVLFAFASVFWLSARVVPPASLAWRLNRLMHYCLCVLVILFGMFAQALLMKTGESLDIGVLQFVFSNLGDLVGVAAGELSQGVINTMLICAGFVLLAALKFERRLLSVLQIGALGLPVFLLPLGSLLEPAPIDPTFQTRALYQGVYKSIGGHQHRWIRPSTPNWQKGILTSLSVGTVLGLNEYQHLESQTSPLPFYEPPRFVGRAAQPRNVLLITLESTRHDVIGVYEGAHGRPSLTPFMDRLAETGVLVERVYTTIPHTSKALIGIFCGVFGRFDSSVFESTPDSLPIPCLPKLLGESGYATAHFQTARGTFEHRTEMLATLGFQHAVTQEHLMSSGWKPFGYLGVDDRAMIDPAVAWMRAQKASGKPFFTSILTLMTHHPYASPNHNLPISDPSQALAAYKRAVTYTDDVIKELFDKMRASDLLDDTLVILTGDHGEAFFEHGQIAHNGSAYEEGMRVPLILFGAGVEAMPKRVTGLRQHIDLLPTVLDAVGLKYSGALPGKSLLSDAVGHKEIITSCFYTNYCLNHYQNNGIKTLYFFGKRFPEIYDLNSDPGELESLAREERMPEIMENLRAAAQLKQSFSAVYARPR